MRSHAVSTDDIRSRLPMSSPLLARFGAGFVDLRGPLAMIRRAILASRAAAWPAAHAPCSIRPPGGNVSDLKAKFEKAVADSKNLPERPDNQTLLKLYALFKQASSGDVEGKRPGFTDMVGRAKWDAWNEIKGTSKDEAMKQYIALIEDQKG
jgi:acyl-CoA-binding protein